MSLYIFVKSYFMGCAFDSFSTSWRDRSYILALMILCLAIPSVNNTICYAMMLHRVVYSDFKREVLKRLQPNCGNACTVNKVFNKRVSKYTLL